VFDPSDGSYYAGKIDGFRCVKYKSTNLLPEKNVGLELLRPARGQNETLDKLEEIPDVGSAVDVLYENLDSSWWQGTVTDIDIDKQTVSVSHYDGTYLHDVPLNRLRWNLEQ
jgi:hypothetical protein